MLATPVIDHHVSLTNQDGVSTVHSGNLLRWAFTIGLMQVIFSWVPVFDPFKSNQKHILLQYLPILWTCAQECIHTISQKRTYLGISATNSPLPLMVSHGRPWFLGGMRLFSWGAAIYKYEIMTIGYYWASTPLIHGPWFIYPGLTF